MVKIRYAILTALLITACWQDVSGATELNVAPDIIFHTLVREHPRLMLKEDALRDLKEQAKNDEVLQRFVREVCRKADDRERWSFLYKAFWKDYYRHSVWARFSTGLSSGEYGGKGTIVTFSGTFNFLDVWKPA